ncbi:ABC transporter substrate-binding protein [Halopenitus sp. H-Gu1]|uniref:ABC transporter substrate-binding protein n=1 Tax=Halopenitus sp. H-Gu1 TaxID=3242697 RepID=UPI00359CCC85
MRISRRDAVKTIGGVGAASLSGLAGCSDSGGTTTLGVIMPVTGTISELGPPCRDGADVAVQEINDAGGLLGNDVEVQHEDSESVPDAGVRSANRLMEEANVPAMVGPLSSGVGMSIAPIAAENGVTYFPGGSSPAFTELDQTDWIFRTRPSDAFVGSALATIAYENRGMETASSIVVNNDFGIGLAESFASAFEELGGEVLTRERANVGQTSYRSELESMFNDDPDVVLNGCYQDEATNIFRQWFEQDLGGEWMIHSGLIGSEFLEGIGEEIADGIFASNPRLPDNDANSHFRSLMEDTDTGDPGELIFPPNTYDAINMITLAAERAGEADGQAIRDNLRDIANPGGTDVQTVGEGLEALRNDEEIRYIGASHNCDLTEKGEAKGLTFSEIEMNGVDPEPVDTIQLG